MHRFTFWLIVSFVAVLSVPTNTKAAFSDVTNNTSINYLAEKGIVKGYPDGSFRPDQTINRAEFVKIVLEAYATANSSGDGPTPTPNLDCFFHEDKQTFQAIYGNLPDVDFGAWYANYVCYAFRSKLVQGYPDGTFRPATSINFVESAKIIAIAFDLPITNTDVWYEGHVRSLAEKKAIPFSISSFDEYITRGEMAEIIYKILVPEKTSEIYIQPQDVVPGQIIGKMEVVSNNFGEPSPTISIRFQGKVTLTGEYWDESAIGGMGPSGMCLYRLDLLSKIGLPVRKYADATELASGMPRLTVKAASLEDYEGGICFDHDEAVLKGFPKGTRGIATVIIDNFVLELSGLEGSTNTATLDRIISVKVKEKVKSIEE